MVKDVRLSLWADAELRDELQAREEGKKDHFKPCIHNDCKNFVESGQVSFLNTCCLFCKHLRTKDRYTARG